MYQYSYSYLEKLYFICLCFRCRKQTIKTHFINYDLYKTFSMLITNCTYNFIKILHFMKTLYLYLYHTMIVYTCMCILLYTSMYICVRIISKEKPLPTSRLNQNVF